MANSDTDRASMNTTSGFLRLGFVLILLALPIAAPAHTNNLNWINRLVLDLFGRLATPAEESGFDGLLDTGTSRQAVAQSFVGSTEFDSLIVQEAYQRFLNRTATPADVASFVGFLQSGVPDKDLFVSCVGSAEYFANSGSTNSGFIDAAYQDLLGRAATSSEVSSWLSALAGGLSRSNFAGALLGSAEGQTRIIAEMYAAYLRRTPTGVEVSAFRSFLGTGATYDQLRASILASSEYFTLAQTLPLVTGCPVGPDTACFAAAKSSLSINLTKRTFAWQWNKGTVDLAQSDFGDPLNGATSYKLCVYDQTSAASILRVEMDMTSGNTCGSKPCWKDVKGLGWSYKSKDGNADGITKAAVKAGIAGKSKVSVQAKGADLPVPTAISTTEVFDQAPAVIVQLHSSDPVKCWSSTFDALSTKKNDGEQFKAKTP